MSAGQSMLQFTSWEWSGLLAFTWIVRRMRYWHLGWGGARETAQPLGWNPPQAKTKHVLMWPAVTRCPSAWKSLCRNAGGLPAPRSVCRRQLGEAGGSSRALGLFGAPRTKCCRASRARDAKELVSLRAAGGRTIFHRCSDAGAFWERPELHVLPVQQRQAVRLQWNGPSEGEQRGGDTVRCVQLCTVRLSRSPD